VTLERLEAALRGIFADRKGSQVQIRADRRTPYQFVVDVHAVVNAVGFRRVDYKCLPEAR
jgi:biopolymer transport protein ExbD